MFNRAPFQMKFNNASTTVDKEMSVSITADSTMYSKIKHSFKTLFNRTGFNDAFEQKYKTFDYNADMTLHADISSYAILRGEYERSIPFASHMSGISTVDVNYIRERLFSAGMHGIAKMIAGYSRYTIKKFEYTGNLLPGDMLIVDMDRMTVVRNNENALKYFEGDFFELAPEWNEIRYKDTESDRNVMLLTRYKDRWL